MHPHAQLARPVHALYKFWSQVLDVAGEWVAYGENGWALHRVGDDMISFGQHGCTYFMVDRRGRFYIGPMHGHYRRNVLAKYVPFLAWSYTHSRYQWLVDFDVPSNVKWWGGRPSVDDWRHPRHYVTEDLIGCRSHYQTNAWCVLEERGGEWTIQPARDQTNNRNGADYNNLVQATLPSLQERWAKYERLTVRRYELAREQELGPAYTPVSVTPPTMLSNNQPLPPDQAVERLAALMEVDKPAKITPLKRPKEATHVHDVDSPYFV